MDRLIAPNTVDAAHADTAPASGTPGYATDGNPATGIPATLWPAYAWNAVQEELIALIAAGGLTPNKASTTQIRDAALALFAKINGDPTKTFQVAPATASNQAVSFGQVSGVVGQARNLVMSVSTASATATLTADEIIVETALGGLRYCLSSFNKTINLGTTGAGGMDTGTAPASGYVAIYAIYNPTTQTAALLATNATSAVAPSVYGGANMPAGYTASALVSVRVTTSGRLLFAGYQRDRKITIASPTAFQTAVATSTPTSVSIAGTVPPNAIEISGTLNTAASNSGVAVQFTVSQDVTGFLGSQENAGSGGNLAICPFTMQLATPQTFFYTATVGAGPFTVAMQISSYSI